MTHILPLWYVFSQATLLIAGSPNPLILECMLTEDSGYFLRFTTKIPVGMARSWKVGVNDYFLDTVGQNAAFFSFRVTLFRHS